MGLERDWTQGNILRNLLNLSWPIMVTSSFNIMGPIIPMIWVGKIGASAVAGLGVANTLAGMFTVAGMAGFVTGTKAIIARFVGASDSAGANHVARQAFVISATYSAVITVVGVLFAERIVGLFGLEPDVVAQGATYLRIQCAGSTLITFRYLAEGIMQSSGDTVIPMRITITYRLVHAILSPFFILGWWFFPRLGVGGAAVTDVGSHGLGLIIGLWCLFSGKTRLRLTLNNFRIDPGVIWRIVTIGIPASVMTLQKNIGNLVLLRVIVPFGTIAVAAHSLMQRVELIMSAPSTGLGQGAGVLTGQNLGAHQPERAQRSGWLAASLAQGYIFVCLLAILLWAENIVRLFTPDPGLVQTASTFLRIATTGYLVMGFEVVLQQCISGSGDTVPPMTVSLVALWLVQLPLAFFLPRITGLGVYGVRWGMVAGMVGGALAYITYFWLGRWKRKKV